ncbi:TolC family protein [Halpernia frigidisoli]|uniref:Outer membrane protein TolC n=1 Tax=Halpernia frigidisoli TaxID=1125876 RepID=A0A1I3CSK0_9FLAO|nr:TolC family protein [Halpernia frigidisoli]SFH77403.1 Outer membrane protein TolC [Halpernia frigidisoli]
MKKINKSLFAFTLFLGFSFLNAQETKMLTLDEAIEMGIKNSKNLKIDQAKISQATADLLEAKNRKLPDFNLSGSYLRLTNANVDLKFLNPTSGNKTPSPSSALIGQANLSLPLYAGGRIKYGIQSAEYLMEASKLKNENNQQAVTYNIAQAYNNLFKANQAIKVLEENLSASAKRDETFLKLENNGLLARNDRLKANLQTSNIELQLLEAQNNYSIATINMDLLIGLKENTILQVDPNYISEQKDLNFVDYYLTQAQQNRKDLQSLAMQRKAAELGTKSAKAEYLPSIALTGGYVAADVPKVLTVYNAVNVGLGIKYNLGNLWKKNSGYIKSQAIEEELAANNELLDDQIKLEVSRDYQNLNFSNQKIKVYQKAQEQAAENFRITKNKYDNGLSNITDLLDADAANTSAEVNIVNAQADAALAYRKLLQTSGILIKN